MTYKRLPTRIIRTDQWHAKPAKRSPVYVGRPQRIIFHHTAGHHAEITRPKDESRAEAMRYARDIQHFHMDSNGWNDSGHNFLITRSGHILVGRHMSLPAIRRGKMVVSAHCPGQNDQPGIEHEHLHEAKMSLAQIQASAELMAWIITCCHMRGPQVIHPHKRFFATSCPAELEAQIPAVQTLTAKLLRDGRK